MAELRHYSDSHISQIWRHSYRGAFPNDSGGLEPEKKMGLLVRERADDPPSRDNYFSGMGHVGKRNSSPWSNNITDESRSTREHYQLAINRCLRKSFEFLFNH